MKKRVVEFNLPLKEISHESAKEKTIRHGHPSTLHIWWARKPLAASRATNFAALIDLPETDIERNKIFKLIQRLVPWEVVNKEFKKPIFEAQELIRNQWQEPPKILDPFAGGGSIPLEAQRLGCETYSNDYNPVSYIIQKATLEWPQRFNITVSIENKSSQMKLVDEEENILVHMLRKWSQEILSEAKNELDALYPIYEDGYIPIGYFWMKEITCQNPNCNKEIPLTSHFYLARIPNKKIALKPIIQDNKIEFKILINKEIDFEPRDGTVKQGKAKCLFCKQIIQGDTIRKLARQNELSDRLVAIVSYHPKKKGKRYTLATNKDFKIFEKSKIHLKEKIQNWELMETPLPIEKLPTPMKKKLDNNLDPFWVHIQAPNYNLNEFKDLFNDRQLLSLVVLLEKIKVKHQAIKQDCLNFKGSFNKSELSKAIICYLGIILNRIADKNSNLVIWDAGRESIGHVFGRASIPMMAWNYVELNPFQDMNGSWSSQLEWVIRFIENTSLIKTASSGITCQSAHKLPYEDNYFDAIFTDPPYYDSVPYADLSDFFYVWLKRSIGDIFPEIFKSSVVPRKFDCIQNNSLLRRRQGITDIEYQDLGINTQNDFEKMLTSCFNESYRVLKNNGIAVIIYAHKTTEGWETMLNSLINSGFVVTSSWPIHTELKERLRSKSSATLSSSIYMISRKIKREKLGFWKDLQQKIRNKIEGKMQQFWDDGIVGGDFFISAIGPGMEIFSKYNNVETYTGEIVSTDKLLQYIRTVVTEFVINKLLKDASPSRIDKESQFYLAYRWTYLNSKVLFDDARKLASAMGINLEKLWTKGFVKKTSDSIHIQGPKERGFPKRIDNMVDIMHYSVLLWEDGKNDELKEFLNKTGYIKNEAFWQFCQAVGESLLPGDKEKQLIEGFLIGRDRYSVIGKKDIKQRKIKDFLGE